MRIGLVAPPFICVPPKKYGGTELFVAHLAEGIQRAGHNVVVYTIGDSEVNAERRWIYEHSEWPLNSDFVVQLKDLAHTAWAVQDAAEDCDVVHVQNAPALAFSNLVSASFVCTMHHTHEESLSRFYMSYPLVQYVAISDFQRRLEKMPRIDTVHHGVDVSSYHSCEEKKDYLVFIGRFAPVKGAHSAIKAAKKAGIPLKLAGEIQPIYRDYFDSEIKPHIDGKFIEYVGEADFAMKNELLGGARALLFPIEWNEPFGLVMIESMACGTPVLAFGGGSVPEIVKGGVSGQICRDANHMAECAKTLDMQPSVIRKYCEDIFSVERMTKGYLDIYRRICERDASVSYAGEQVAPVNADDLTEEAAA
jgi:glycosyltransferase involved in cell wall biosynthesis